MRDEFVFGVRTNDEYLGFSHFVIVVLLVIYIISLWLQPMTRLVCGLRIFLVAGGAAARLRR